MKFAIRIAAFGLLFLMTTASLLAQDQAVTQKNSNPIAQKKIEKTVDSAKSDNIAAQSNSNNTTGPSKKNSRPATAQTPAPARSVGESFDGASAAKMGDRCVTLETEAGTIALEMLPEAAPESVRNFLNLAATGAFDTTTFSRVIKGFVIQGGNLATGQKWSMELAQRAARAVPDEPNYVKHVRGVVSMARGDKPNSATTHFFILAGDAPHLDGKFAAFGRVTSGIEVVDEINQAPTDGEKPVKPIHITHAIVAPCVKG